MHLLVASEESQSCESAVSVLTATQYTSRVEHNSYKGVLRCQSFDDIKDRLNTMQGELSWLTQTLKQSNISGRAEPIHENTTQAVHVSPSPKDEAHISSPTIAGHLVRDDGTQIERYYGPWTLVAQCRDFEVDLSTHHLGITYETVGSIVKAMLCDATSSDDDDHDFNNNSRPLDTNICLPPRQLLSVMLDTFLKHADYNTDIFCHSTIYEAIDRVYRDPSGPLSEAWSLCFNLIILLTLGAEHPVHSQDPFVRPMLQAAHATARKPNIFMTPRLVNVQALALFVSETRGPTTQQIVFDPTRHWFGYDANTMITFTESSCAAIPHRERGFR